MGGGTASIFFLIPYIETEGLPQTQKKTLRKEGNVLEVLCATHRFSGACHDRPNHKENVFLEICINYHHWRDIIYIYIIASQVLLVPSQANKFVAIKEHKLLWYVLNSANGKLCLFREVARTQSN